MDTSEHFSLSALFLQLGLPEDDASISEFIENHPLKPDIKLADAPFWSASQSGFLKSAIEEDSDWAEAVDHLDAELRQSL